MQSSSTEPPMREKDAPVNKLVRVYVRRKMPFLVLLQNEDILRLFLNKKNQSFCHPLYCILFKCSLFIIFFNQEVFFKLNGRV